MNVYPHGKQASCKPTHTHLLSVLHTPKCWRLEEDEERKRWLWHFLQWSVRHRCSHVSLVTMPTCHWVFAAGAALWVCQSTAERADGCSIYTVAAFTKAKKTQCKRLLVTKPCNSEEDQFILDLSSTQRCFIREELDVLLCYKRAKCKPLSTKRES